MRPVHFSKDQAHAVGRAPRLERSVSQGLGGARFASFIAVFCILIQQDAFVSLPLVFAQPDWPLGAAVTIENPYNSVGIGLSLILIGIACLSRIRQIKIILVKNLIPLTFLALVLVSCLWSIHPDITLRRGVGYFLTLFVSVYLIARFELDDAMKLMSYGFAISALSSFLFVAAFPHFGIMNEGALAGNWRGVFAHKNELGLVMAVAVFVELYLIANYAHGRYWRFVLLGSYVVLILLSECKGALIILVWYLACAIQYLIFRLNKIAGLTTITIGVLTLCLLLLALLADQEYVLGVLGKDASLTGRTQLWSVVVELIAQKPIWGWGYRAVWIPLDPMSVRTYEMFGWAVPSSHNAFLEITLQLGIVGFLLMMLMICIALVRALRCCSYGINPLGWFSLSFFIGVIIVGQTEANIAQNQIISWVLFNLLLFGCGFSLCSNQLRDNGIHEVKSKFDLRRKYRSLSRGGSLV